MGGPKALQNLRALVTRLQPGKAAENQDTLKLLAEVTELLAIYSPADLGAGRHRRYLDYLLKGRRKQPVVGDITPAYMMLAAEDFAEMAKIGAARFVLVLRDPVERLWAQICANTAAGRGPAEHLAVSVSTARQMLEAGNLHSQPEADYARAMAALEASVLPSRIKYLFHERLQDQSTLDDLCDFLGIPARAADTTAAPPPQDRDPALPDDLRAALRHGLQPQYQQASLRFGASLPEAWS